ncbi:hypothetical protein [Sinanaerobacter chloroacetimidivorans]|uniref:hypothetical protein n=1 Tax=Sinanaerobacter chloroacetimidivorans TaxID=2818044 RepID=UPI001D057DEB|nr:hypothetical protein [Sinanaerobacter chloroacetimidivorans]
MINKEELLNLLQEYNYYIITKLVDLQSQSKRKRGIMQRAVYHNVKLQWNGSVFKFWNSENDDNIMYLNSDITNFELIRDDRNKDILKVYITDCPEVVEMSCGRHHHWGA